MKNKILIQDNVLTTARYEMTALEKNIMYAVMAQIEEEDPATKYYQISTFDIADAKDMRVKKEEFEKAITRLLTRDFTIKAIDGLIQSTFIASAKYKTDGIVEIEISTRLRPYLFALKKNFTLFGLEVAMSLKSKYAKRLYEMLCQFKSTGLMRVSIEELKARFQLVNTEGVEQYERWSSFEKKVLLIGQTEINEKAEFQFDYHLKKQGRKITAVEFIFRKPDIKPEPPPVITLPVVVLPQVQHASPRIIERLEKYGLNIEKINNILMKHTEKVINKQLYELDCNRETVKNTAAYLLKVFEVS
jgi:plasmid replication initiation protein